MSEELTWIKAIADRNVEIHALETKLKEANARILALENKLADKTAELVETKEGLEEAIALQEVNYNEGRNLREEELSTLQAEIVELKSQRDELLEAGLKGNIPLVILDRNKSLQAQLEELRWRAVAEVLPKVGKEVFLCGSGQIFVGIWSGKKWVGYGITIPRRKMITHWMPIPPLPETEKVLDK
jgi:chromosome segregation ATPase